VDGEKKRLAMKETICYKGDTMHTINLFKRRGAEDSPVVLNSPRRNNS
jgi:hypothetical protein